MALAAGTRAAASKLRSTVERLHELLSDGADDLTITQENAMHIECARARESLHWLEENLSGESSFYTAEYNPTWMHPINLDPLQDARQHFAAAYDRYLLRYYLCSVLSLHSAQ
jgi:hypothetical protein